jgi:hypothetical protein
MSLDNLLPLQEGVIASYDQLPSVPYEAADA